MIATRLAILLAMTLPASADLLTIPLSTNRYTNPLPVRVEAILTPCPVCGGPEHHRREIRSYVAFDLVTILHVLDGAMTTNYATGPTTRWSTTGIVAIATGRTKLPPLPGSPQNYTTATNRVEIPWTNSWTDRVWNLAVPPSGDTHALPAHNP